MPHAWRDQRSVRGRCGGAGLSGTLVCMDQLRAGSVLAGRYRLAGLAGAAKMLSLDSVWRALDEVTRLEIAVKVLDAREDGDPGIWAQAARVLTRLRCPGVAQVHDDGQATTPGGVPVRYLV